MFRLPGWTSARLDNGVGVHLMEIHGLPLVDFHVVTGAGAGHDPEGKEGLADFVSDLLRKGTERRTAQQIADEVDFVGGELDTEADLDATQVTAEFLSRDLETGLDLLADIIINPSFSAEEVDRLRGEKLGELRALRENPSALASRRFIEILFKGHPYGHPRSGWESTVSSLTRDDVTGFYERTCAPGNTIVVAVGDFDAERMLQSIEKRFGSWTGEDKVPRKLPVPEGPAERALYLVDKPESTQSQIRIGGVGIDRRDPDYIPLTVANTILGGGFTSRLVQEIRVNRGLSYGASSRIIAPVQDGPFLISTFTKNESTLETVRVTMEVLERFRQEGGTDEEVDKARKYLKGGFAINHQTPGDMAESLAEIAFYDLPADYYDTYLDRIMGVTADDVRRVARRFPFERTAILVLGEAEAIRKDLETLGPIVNVPLVREG